MSCRSIFPARTPQRLGVLLVMLACCTAPAAVVSFTGSWSLNTAIPDDDANGVASTQTVDADFRTLGSISLHLVTTGGWNGDLYAYLVHSSGFSVLINRPGVTESNSAGSDNSGFDVTFSLTGSDIHTDPTGSAAVTGEWQADGRNVDPATVLDSSPRTALLSNFVGLDPSGEWTLFIADMAGGDEATLTQWGLTLRPPDYLNVTDTMVFSNTKNAYNGPINVLNQAVMEVFPGGTVTAMTSINVNGGTLLLSGSGTERINDGTGEAPLTLLSGGKLRLNGSTIVESFGMLTVSNGGVVDFGSGNGRVNFGDSSGATWSGTLSIWNWSGDDQLFFGSTAFGLSAEQIAAVQFYSDGGSMSLGGAVLSSNGSLMPVPEAESAITAAILLAFALPSRRGRIMRKVSTLPFLAVALLALHGAVWAHGPLHEIITAVTQQIEADPDNAKLLVQRGDLHRQHQDWAAAEKDFAAAERIEPQLADIFLGRAALLLDQGRAAEAESKLDSLLQHVGSLPAANLLRAKCRDAQRRPIEAAADLDAAIAAIKDPWPDIYLDRVALLRKANQDHLETALRGLDEGIAKCGPLLALQKAAVELELDLHRPAAALNRIEIVLKSAPKNLDWLCRKVAVLRGLNRSAEADSTAQAALKLIAAMPESRRQAPAVREIELTLQSQNHAP